LFVCIAVVGELQDSCPVVSDEFLEEHHRVLDLRLQPVVREITESHARTRDELESLYRKIVSCILLRSGLGLANDIGVVREATGSSFSLYYFSVLSCANCRPL